MLATTEVYAALLTAIKIPSFSRKLYATRSVTCASFILQALKRIVRSVAKTAIVSRVLNLMYDSLLQILMRHSTIKAYVDLCDASSPVDLQRESWGAVWASFIASDTDRALLFAVGGRHSVRYQACPLGVLQGGVAA